MTNIFSHESNANKWFLESKVNQIDVDKLRTIPIDTKKSQWCCKWRYFYVYLKKLVKF